MAFLSSLNMRFYFSFLLLFFFASSSMADQGCGIHPTSEETQQIFEYRKQLKQFSPFLRTGQSDIITIPVKAHIIDDGKGSNKYDIQTLLTQLCDLNVLYAPVGFYFYLVPDVNFVNDSRYIYPPNGIDDAELLLGNLLFQHYLPGALNVYYTLGTGLCGMAPFPSWSVRYGGRTGVLMEANKQCSGAGAKTLAHEIGHHFDLLHTFQGYDSKDARYHEYVTRDPSLRNCETAGDGFCDTPADILDFTCPYTGNAKDIRGAFYNPDVSLLMSYHGDFCQNKFSEEEIQHMKDVIQNDDYRKVYLNNQITDFQGVASSQLLEPIPSAQIPSGQKIKFRWERVEGADAYLFKIATVADRVYYQQLVYDADSVEYEFPSADVGRTYQWNIVPVRFNQPCSQSSAVSRFRIVGSATGVFNNEVIRFAVYPNPVSGGKNLTLQFDEYSLRDMKERMSVKISSLNGQTVQEVSFDRISEKMEIRLNDNLSSGVYFIHFQSGDVVYQSKLIVQ